MMSGKTRYKVRYKRASTDLYRWGEPDRDMYVRKWQYVRKRECISNSRFTGVGRLLLLRMKFEYDSRHLNLSYSTVLGHQPSASLKNLAILTSALCLQLDDV